MAPQSRSVQQLAEVLTTLVSSSTEAAATQGAVERIAECFDSEVGAVVRDGQVLAAIGFRKDGVLASDLVRLAGGHGDTLEVPGAGPCQAVVVAIPSESRSRLLLARSGDEGYSAEELSLLRSMGRILANALDMLHLRDMVAASEARFRGIVETANEGIWLLDVDGATTFANDKTGEILGYPPEEMGALSLFDVLDEQGKQQAASNLERRRQGISDQLECAFVRKDGSRVWVLLNASPMVDAEGTFAGSLCMISDITPRKRMEDMLSRREQQLAEAQRVAGVGSFEWDIVGDRLTWSDELYRMLRVDPAEPVRSYADYVAHVHPEDRPSFLDRVQQGVAGSVPSDAEYRIVRGEGEEVLWVRVRSEIVLDDSGRTALLRGTVLDINASKLTEEALRETTARFRLLQAMATAANEASCLEDVLEVAVREICAHTGWVAGHAYLPAGALGDSVVPLTIWHLDDDETLGALPGALEASCLAPATGAVARALVTRAAAWCEPGVGSDPSDLERVAADCGLGGAFAFPVCVGPEVTCILEFFSPKPLDPDPVLLETIAQVATQLSRVAERQRASHELATARDAAMESSRLKSDFLATMSHEIRTPMNGVIGLTGLLLNTDLDSRQRQYAEGVQAAGDALLAIINDILDFSKIEAGRLELEVIDFDPVQVVEEAAGLVAEPAQRKGLELLVSCDADLPGNVVGDPARLRQVLLNLASNAVKFTPEGEVLVRAGLVHDPEDGAGDGDTLTIRFEVVDTGIGIDESHRPRLFEPFSQADASTTRRFGGTGLGLAISRRLVGAMGGELGFDSEPGRGSTFWFTLPLRRRDTVDGRPAATPARPRGLKVLVVEDNETGRRLLGDQLRRWDLECRAVAGGAEALAVLRDAALRGRPFDVAFLDAGMPGMGGFELARRMAADPLLARTRPVFLTSASTAAPAGALPGAASLAKPVRLSQLAESLVQARPAGVPAKVSTLPSAPPSVSRGHVLVVEDNTSNQLVAVGILRLLGYRSDVASDGVEALAALRRTDFDAILMDCQMPEMDGFTATGEIRRREGSRRHTPVIAMTAGASDSDRQRCLAAGMDDFLSKPVKPHDVGAVLARWVAGPAPAEAEDEADEEASSVLDHDLIDELRDLAPDGSLLVQIVDTFLATAPEHVAELRAAASSGDAALVRQSAHRLRGESGALGAVEVARLCATLEESAAESLDRAPMLASAIQSAFDRAAAELRVLAGGAGRTAGVTSSVA